MDNFKVVVEHDFYSRKPIYITFKLSVVEKHTGSVLHSDTFKHRSFTYGLLRAEKYEEVMLQPQVVMGLMARDISQKLGFELDKDKGFEDFLADMFKHSSTEFLQEYLLRTKNETDIATIKNELKKRGEMIDEKLICTGSNGK